MLQDEGDVWNRVFWDGNGWTASAPGDRALADMLRAHGESFHGGALNVVDALTETEFVAAIKGYRYFGVDAAARALEEARAQWREEWWADEAFDEVEAELDRLYWSAVPSDQVLFDAFVERFRVEPSAFEPYRGPYGTDA